LIVMVGVTNTSRFRFVQTFSDFEQISDNWDIRHYPASFVRVLHHLILSKPPIASVSPS